MTPQTHNAFRAAAWTALFTFVALFGASLLGWLQEVTAWATADGGTVVFPDPAPLAKAIVAAIAAAFSGLVNFVVRWAQGRAGVGEVPTYTPATTAERGAAAVETALVVALILLAATVLWTVLT